MTSKIPPAHQNSIPTTVISGFLGAGKTSYINGLIADKTLSANSVILVNDFGSINIDYDLIEHSEDKLMKLSNGCICCTLSGMLIEQLAQVLTLSDTIDHLYMEASGIADPVPIAETITLSPDFTLDKVLCLVDVSQIDKYLGDKLVSDAWLKQVRAATDIVLNRLGDISQSDAISRIGEHNKTAHVEVDTHGITHQKKLTHKILETSMTPQSYAPDATFKSSVQSFSVVFQQDIGKQALEDLLVQYQNTLLRAKGTVKIKDDNTTQVIQLSGNSISWWQSPPTSTYQLVCIGYASAGLDELKQKIQHL